MSAKKLISIHLNSNKPKSFEKFISSIVHNSQNLENIEILVSIDKNDIKMIDSIKKINCNKKDLIRYIETDLIKTFADAWKPLNILLENTSSSVVFISCMSDDVRFLTKNWDAKIRGYENYYKDKICRIRCSKFKMETYKDIWECGYKPDSYAFYSKRWLQIVNKWNPCIGPDTFQECIAYYMRNYGSKHNREIIDKDIQFSGQEVSNNLNFKTRVERSRIYYKAFFILMSYKVQSSANNSAYELIKIISGNNNIKKKLLSRMKIYYTNFIRRLNFFYYRGSPEHFINSKFKNIIFFIWCYSNFSDKYLVRTVRFLSRKKYLEKIISDKKKLEKIKKIINHNESS